MLYCYCKDREGSAMPKMNEVEVKEWVEVMELEEQMSEEIMTFVERAAWQELFIELNDSNDYRGWTMADDLWGQLEVYDRKYGW